MDLSKISALKAIYSFYDDFLKGFPIACKKGCSTCCTTNVCVTSLEVEYLLKEGDIDKKQIESIKKASQKEHFIPNTTINTSAALYLSKRNPPEDSYPQDFERCPLLTSDGLCSIYPWRPFSCRSMSSETVCTEGGEARMEPFLVTVNLAIYQILEHIDADGWYGNLLDVIELFNAKGDYESNSPPSLHERIKTNRPLPGFMVPPEEMVRFKSFLRRLSKVRVDSERSLSDFLPENLFG